MLQWLNQSLSLREPCMTISFLRFCLLRMMQCVYVQEHNFAHSRQASLLFGYASVYFAVTHLLFRAHTLFETASLFSFAIIPTPLKHPHSYPISTTQSKQGRM